jgi:hypothetical protein
MARNTWAGDWVTRVAGRVRELGFADFTTFAGARPKATYFQLAAEVGDGAAPVQIAWLLYDEALASGGIVDFAKASIVRELRHYLTEGWSGAPGGSLGASKAYAAWSSTMDDAFGPIADATWGRLKIAAYGGWVPDGPTDPVVAAGFAGHEAEWQTIAIAEESRRRTTRS